MAKGHGGIRGAFYHPSDGPPARSVRIPDRLYPTSRPLGLWCARQVLGLGPASPQGPATIGDEYRRFSARDALLIFQVELTLGEERSPAPNSGHRCSGFRRTAIPLRGRWFEVDSGTNSRHSPFSDQKKFRRD